MAKFGSFLILLVAGFVCAQSVRIDPPSLKESGKYSVGKDRQHDPRCTSGDGYYPDPDDCTKYFRCTLGQSQHESCPEGQKFDSVKKCTSELADCGNKQSMRTDDARCNKGDGLYPNPNDCTKYFACKGGKSQDRTCPEGFKFDTVKHCTPDPDADCGKKQLRKTADEPSCPRDYGMFVYKEDCHKFIVCVEGRPSIHECPEGTVYSDIGGCVPGTECNRYPESKSETSVCEKADDLYPHESNCLRYIKCVNFAPTVKGCPIGRAFDPKKKICSREQFNKCKINDLHDIV